MRLLRTAAHVGVASAVAGRVQRRQRGRWAADEQSVPQQAAAPAAAPAASGTSDMLAQLASLGELRTSGVLTDAEFETQKARILAS